MKHAQTNSSKFSQWLAEREEQNKRFRKFIKREIQSISALFLTVLSLCYHSDLIDGYTGERATLEQQLRHKEELQLSLEQELQVRHSSCREEENNYLVNEPAHNLIMLRVDFCILPLACHSSDSRGPIEASSSICT